MRSVPSCGDAGAPGPSTGGSRRCCSPTSSDRPSGRAALGDAAWRGLVERHDARVAATARRFRGRESTPPATASWPRSTARHAPFAARTRSGRRSGARGSRSAPASTPVRSSWSATISAGSRSTSAPGSRRSQGPREVLVVPDGQGPHRRIRPHLRGRRRTRAEGRARSMAPLPGGRSAVSAPETRYARTADGLHIAYQLVGDGPVDIVYVAGWFSNVDLIWDVPEIAPFLRRLAARPPADRVRSARDRPVRRCRGVAPPRRDARRRLLRDGCGRLRARHPDRADDRRGHRLPVRRHLSRAHDGLVLIAGNARTAWAEDYQWGDTPEEHREETDRIDAGWGTGEFERWFLRNTPTRRTKRSSRGRPGTSGTR